MAGKQTKGVDWIPADGGKVSTTDIGKQIWIAAAGEDSSVAAAIKKEKNWRNGYAPHVVAVAQMQASGDNAVASRGLAAARKAFGYKLDGGNVVSLDEAAAMADNADKKNYFATGTIAPANRSDGKLRMPHNGVEMQGDELLNQVKAWCDYGAAEPSLLDSVKFAVSTGKAECAATIKDTTFVLLGGTSEACAARPLLQLGARVACIARNGAKLNSLIDFAISSNGTLLVPVQGDATTAADEIKTRGGASVLDQVPELIAWISSLSKTGKLVIANYIYLDSEAHVRATLAMDTIVEAVTKKFPSTALAYLNSPSTAHTAPDEAVRASEQAYNNPGFGLFRLNPLRWMWYRNYHATRPSGPVVFDGLVSFQGPNYALAKTLQTWRAIVQRCEKGSVVSARFAPAMRTDSMMHVSTVKAFLDGIEAFPPNIALRPDTAAAVMTAVLLYDVTSPNSSANPKQKLSHQLELLHESSFHGGGWRAPYSGASLGAATFIVGKTFGSRAACHDATAK